MTTDTDQSRTFAPQSSTDEIIARVAKKHLVSPAQITGAQLLHHIVLARCEAIRTIKAEKPWFSLQRIGAAFGGMHHSAVQHHLGGKCRCGHRHESYGRTAGGAVAPSYMPLTPNEFGSVRERFAEGFDTHEIRDQIVFERLANEKPALIHESQIYNALPTEEHEQNIHA